MRQLAAIRIALGLAAAVSLLTACNGTNGTGDVVYFNDTVYGAAVSDNNPHVTYPIVSGQSYATDEGTTYSFVILTYCGGNLYTYGSYTGNQTKGSWAIVPVNGNNDEQDIAVSDCGTTVTDNITTASVKPKPGAVAQNPNEVVLDHTFTSTVNRNGITYTYTWTYTRDPSVANGLDLKPLLKSE